MCTKRQRGAMSLARFDCAVTIAQAQDIYGCIVKSDGARDVCGGLGVAGNTLVPWSQCRRTDPTTTTGSVSDMVIVSG
jgi:hypothetical protein